MIRICIHGDRPGEGTTTLATILRDLLTQVKDISVHEVSSVSGVDEQGNVNQQGFAHPLHARQDNNSIHDRIQEPMQVSIYDVDD